MKYLKYVLSAIVTIAAFYLTGTYIMLSMNSTSTEIANELAMKQMENTDLSSQGIQVYSGMVNAMNVLPLVIGVLWLLVIVCIVWIARTSRKDVNSK